MNQAALVKIKEAIEFQNEIDALSARQLPALQQAGQLLAGLAGDGIPAIKALPIPWASQLGTDASYSNSDCGPTCATMWLRWLGKAVTVDQVSIATGLPRGYKYTLPANLMMAAKTFGLNLTRTLNVSIDALCASIDQGAPGLVLVHYASLPTRFDPKFYAGHWVLFVGYTLDGKDVLYHDPYWPDTRGQQMRVSRLDFERAMRECSIDGNTPNQALLLSAFPKG
jgi:uncharacterized protein YvpB